MLNISLLFQNHVIVNIRDIRRIRNMIDHTSAPTIVNSLIHSKIDCCNSLLLNPPATKINRLQLVLNSAAHAVTRTPKSHYIIPILKSLHWLTINQRIQGSLALVSLFSQLLSLSKN